MLPSKNDTSLYSHLARGLHEPSGRWLQVSLKLACLMVKPHWVQEDLSASEPTNTASENNRYYLAPMWGGLVLLTSGCPWAQTHSNHLNGPWESKATARLANTPVDRAIPNNSISGAVIYSRSLVPPLLKTADISPKQGLTTFCLHRPLYLLLWIFMNVLRGHSC